VGRAVIGGLVVVPTDPTMAGLNSGLGGKLSAISGEGWNTEGLYDLGAIFAY
jgi:hypothetical protein